MDMNWRMTFPSRYDFSFKRVTSKRLMASVGMERVPKISRALVLNGAKAMAIFHGRPNKLAIIFSILFRFNSGFERQDRPKFATYAIWRRERGSPYDRFARTAIDCTCGKGNSPILTSRSISNDGAWHNLVLSKDSLGNLRFLIDAQSPATGHVSLVVFKIHYRFARHWGFFPYRAKIFHSTSCVFILFHFAIQWNCQSVALPLPIAIQAIMCLPFFISMILEISHDRA